MKPRRAEWAAVAAVPAALLFYSAASMRIIPNFTGLIDHAAFALLFLALFLATAKPLARLALTASCALYFTGEVVYHRVFGSWAHFEILLHRSEMPIALDGIRALLRPADMILGLALPAALAWAARSFAPAPRSRAALRLALAAALGLALHAAAARPGFLFAENNPFFFPFRQAARVAQLNWSGGRELARIAADADRYQPLDRARRRRTGGRSFPFETTPLDDAPPAQAPGAKKMNVVLVLLESVRAFESGAYGARPSFTPNFDRLAKEGRLFSTFYANASQTTKSEYALHASYMPNYAGGATYVRNPAQAVVTLPAILKRAGYRSHWISSYPPTFGSKKSFLSRHGVDHFHSTYGSGLPRLGPGPSDENLFDFALNILDRETGPFFAEILTLTNHFPYQWDYPTKRRTPRVRGDPLYQAYTQGIYYTDHALGKFFQEVRRRPWAKNTLFVVTGDHGMMLFPQDAALDNAARQEIFFRVPLLLWSPGNVAPGADGRLASHLDVAPTVLDFLGLRAKHSFLGRSLLRPPAAEPFVFTLHDERWNLRFADAYLYDAETVLYNDHFPFRPEAQRGMFTPSRHAAFTLDGDLLRDHAPEKRRPLPEQRGARLESFADEALAAYLVTSLRDRISRPADVYPDGAPAAAKTRPPKWIAHAGGAVNGEIYTNSLEALEQSYHQRGHRFFELDFELAADGRYVLLHDWQKTYSRLFGRRDRVGADEFVKLKMRGGLTPLTPDALLRWLTAHPQAQIVTDVKNDNHRALNTLWRQNPELIGRFIAQIYRLSEYRKVRYLGYDRIILTLYRSGASDEQVLTFAENNELYAVAMPVQRALESDLAQRLSAMGIFVYAHTVNDEKLAERLAQRGVRGFFTDTLAPRSKPPDPVGAHPPTDI
ncbi:MAG: sulfatase-like hydrolase/transferase [Elusimicrobiota bacterium]